MKYIISVAHTDYNQDDNARKENALSDLLSSGVYYLMLARGATAELIDRWGGKGHDPDERSLTTKIREVNRIAKESSDPCLAVEIHFNGERASNGTCVLHDATSKRSKIVAETVLKSLLPSLGRGRHSHGVIPFPSPYRDVTLAFLRQTTCRAIIIEVDSIRFFDEFLSNPELIENTAKAIAEALELCKP